MRGDGGIGAVGRGKREGLRGDGDWGEERGRMWGVAG